MSRWKRRDWLAATAASGLVVALGACRRDARGTAARPAPAGVLRIAQRNEPSTLDPALSLIPDELFVLRALLEGLVAPAPGRAEPQPAAASHWDVTADGTVYTFYLRPDGAWSDGAPVTAHDFVYSLRRVLDPAIAAPKSMLLRHIAGADAFRRGETTDPTSIGVQALDDRRLEVRLTRRAPEFLAYVASAPWLPVPRTAVEAHGGEWTRPGRMVVNGPCELSEWRPQQHIIVRRRAAYTGPLAVSVPELQFLVFDSGDAEDRAYRAGQLDVTMAVPVARLPVYAASQSRQLRRAPLFETRYLAFHTRRGPLRDVRVRRALSLAVDRTTLVERVLTGGQLPAHHFVPRGLGGYSPTVEITGSPERARALLAEAGFAGGEGFPRLEVTTWTGAPVLEAIQAMWHRELGIEVAIQQREARVHIAALRAGDFDIGFITAIPDVSDPADLLDEFLPDAPANNPRWESAAFVQAVHAAAAAPTSAQRLQHLAAAEAVLLAEAPVAPLYFNTQNFLVADRVRGWTPDPLWTRHYQTVSLADA